MLLGELALLGGDEHDAVAPDLGVDRLELLQDGAAGVVVGARTTVCRRSTDFIPIGKV